MSASSNSDQLASMHMNGIRLAAFVLLVAVLLMLSYQATSDRVVEQRFAAERRALNDALPAAAHDNDLLATAFALDPANSNFTQIALLGLSVPRNGYRAVLQGQPSGVIIPAETAGFNGPVILMVGIDADGSITGVRVDQHRETRGLGDGIDVDISPWILAFNNRSLENTPEVLWRVKKDGGDFDQFVGATITPRAVVAAIHNALLFFDANSEALLAEQLQ